MWLEWVCYVRVTTPKKAKLASGLVPHSQTTLGRPTHAPYYSPVPVLNSFNSFSGLAISPTRVSVLQARNPIKFDHFQPFLCGFFDCIPESRDPIVPQLACGPRFARAPRRENYLCNRTI